MFDSIEDMESVIDGWVQKEWNVYYATAGFGAADNAQTANAVAKRELYVDVDCGPDKPYATKQDGLSALKAFVLAMHLPRPTIIDSGNGIHAHWIFTNAVPVHEWEAVASALKEQCSKHRFEVDSACTADVVRVLRVPDTVNFKGGNTVVLLTPVKYFKFEILRDIIGVGLTPTFDIAKAKALSQTRDSQSQMSEISKLLASNRVSKYETILIKSNAGEGCAQIKWAYENQEYVSEPLWRANLSIAQFCEDRDWGIHEISKGHPNYDPSETEHKANQTKGPYTCQTFQTVGVADLCAGCPHNAKISSPIQLGTEIAKAPNEPVEVVEEEETYVIPRLPDPYFRGKNGGIYMRSSDGTQDLIYPHDFYIYSRMRDRELGYVACFRLHTPKDGVREFVVPISEIGARDKFRAEINKHGLFVFDEGQVKKLQNYVEKQLREIQMEDKAENMHIRFGWTEDNTFIIGNREYTKDGMRVVPMARTVDDLIRWFEPKGSLDEWKKIAAFYDNPELDWHAIGTLAGFGSVLMKFTAEHGGVLNFFSKKSGTGKTTILRVVSSIFGHPDGLMKLQNDSAMSKLHRMGVYNGIPMVLDEMTSSSPQEVSHLLFAATQGRARDRMEAGKNAERVNSITWDSISVWTGNTSCGDKLSSIKLDPQGELARVLDVNLQTPPPDSVVDALRLFSNLHNHYGHAGHVFISYLMQQDQEKIKELMTAVQNKIYKKHLWTQTERFQLNIVICIVAAGIICKQIGLVDYDLSRITNKLCDFVKDMRDEVKNQSMSAVEMLATFLNKNINNMLIINDAVRNVPLAGMVAPDLVPKNMLMIRYEPDTKVLYISQRDLNRWCSENYLNAKEIRPMFKEETGKEITLIKKRMGKGWSKDFGPVLAYEIQDAQDVLGMEFDPDVLAADATDTATEGDGG
jgi:hypothetical protein